MMGFSRSCKKTRPVRLKSEWTRLTSIIIMQFDLTNSTGSVMNRLKQFDEKYIIYSEKNNSSASQELMFNCLLSYSIIDDRVMKLIDHRSQLSECDRKSLPNVIITKLQTLVVPGMLKANWRGKT